MRQPREYRKWLLDQRRELTEQEDEAYRELMAAEAADGPYKAAFYLAHENLAQNYADYLAGRVDRTKLFIAYDARMMNGYHWNPHKIRLKDAQRWHKAIMSELRYVNQQLDPPKPKAKPYAR